MRPKRNGRGHSRVKPPGEISTAKSLGCSAAAGGLAHAICYPLHLARTVLQQPVPEGGRVYSGFVDVLTSRMKAQVKRPCRCPCNRRFGRHASMELREPGGGASEAATSPPCEHAFTRRRMAAQGISARLVRYMIVT